MKFGMSVVWGIATFFIGVFAVLFLVGVFSQTGGTQVTSSIFNAGIMGLVASILFLSAIIVFCTLAIIDTIKGKNQ